MDSQRRIQLQFDQVRSRSTKKRIFLILKSSRFIFLVKKLQQLHDKHLTRPDFDENSSEEKEIESLTKDITTVKYFIFNMTKKKQALNLNLDVKWLSFICTTTFITNNEKSSKCL